MTILFDLLPFYPMFIVFGYVGIIVSLILWLDVIYWIWPFLLSTILAIILMFYCVKWIHGYRMKRYAEFLDKLKDEKFSADTIIQIEKEYKEILGQDIHIEIVVVQEIFKAGFNDYSGAGNLLPVDRDAQRRIQCSPAANTN